ncbi:MAG: hypothetical protein K1060chlam3_00036 [Candidatus Anoxychlamydiales bacterium]|nr:hypothetical protein [Candidatus Anoxychlamydiales bacterium]
MTTQIKNKIDKKKNILEITPIFFPPSSYDLRDFENFITSTQNQIKSIIPKNILNDFNNAKTKDEIKNTFLKMNQALPCILHSNIAEEKLPFSVSFSFFSFSDLVEGISRFIFDMLNKWLTLTHPIDINANRSIKFKFKKFPQKTYYLSEYFINVSNEKEKSLIKRNIKSFIDEMKLIIMSANYTKNISSSILSKNSASVHMNNYISKFSKEKKLHEIKENLAFLMYKSPKIFDNDIFDSLHLTSLIFKGDFTTIRNPKHVSRIIAFSYFFKKSINQIKSQIQTNKRYVKLKILKTNLSTQKKPILGILIVMDILYENEYFEKKYILESISQIIKNLRYLKNSFITDRRDPKVLSYYLEIEKKELNYFSLKEITDLKKKLSLAFSSKMKKLVNPIYLPRNEEEILRNIIILTKQLNYVKDIPQVIISFDKQSSKEISFRVILLRLLKKDSLSLKDLFSYSKTLLKFSLDETKNVGLLKKNYPKEANVFKLSLNKFDFLRRDHSIDLRKARQTIFTELTNILGNFRDFNGGLLSKQLDAMENLKKIMLTNKKSSDFILEEFFYSIKPTIQQTIVDAKILKKLFLMFIKILKKEFKNSNCLIDTKTEKNQFYIIIKTPFTKIKDDIILAVKKLKFKSFETFTSSIDRNDQKTLGFALISKDSTKKDLLYKTIIKEIEKSFKI